MATNTTNVNTPAWRESSSLIICAKSPEELYGCDYKILVLKRSDRTSKFKNQGVFPGGIFEPSDESIEWLKYFEDFGVPDNLLRELIIVDNETQRPKIFASQGSGCYDRFFKGNKIWAREISLRINAIRETFEEVGIFLCRTRDQIFSVTKEGFIMSEFDQSKWQKLVHHDPKEFLNMCKEHQVIPDLWGLHEWCSWASPTLFEKGYETAFFITFLNTVPKVMGEESEVKECLWLPPVAYFQMMREAKLLFYPPQVYELSRLIPQKSFNEVKRFSWERRKRGITMYLPIVYACTDGLVFVLPGDDFYTGDPYQITAPRNMDCSKAEFRARTKCLNRIVNPGTPNVALHSNIKPFNGHLMPVSGGVENVHKL